MEEVLSRIVLHVDTHEEAARMEKRIAPIIHATRGDAVEVRTITKPHADGVSVTIYVIIYTMNLFGMAHDLKILLNSPEPCDPNEADHAYEGRGY